MKTEPTFSRQIRTGPLRETVCWLLILLWVVALSLFTFSQYRAMLYLERIDDLLPALGFYHDAPSQASHARIRQPVHGHVPQTSEPIRYLYYGELQQENGFLVLLGFVTIAPLGAALVFTQATSAVHLLTGRRAATIHLAPLSDPD